MQRGKILLLFLTFLVLLTSLVYFSTRQDIQFFMTVEEALSTKETLASRPLRVLGVVIGETIAFDARSGILTFEIAHVPSDNAELEAKGGLAAVLHTAAQDPQRARLTVRYHGLRPTLLKEEAQVVVSGHFGEDGIFEAEEILLKCPSRYEEALPEPPGGQ